MMADVSRRFFLLSAGAGALSLRGLSTVVQAASRPYGRPKLKITDVRTAMVRVHGRQLHVSDRPGIGVEMNEEAARRYQVPGTTWFEAQGE